MDQPSVLSIVAMVRFDYLPDRRRAEPRVGLRRILDHCPHSPAIRENVKRRQ